MTTNHLDSERLGAYVLGTLATEENTEVEEHNARCEACRTEVAELREIEAVLGEVPPEAFLVGPPEGGEMMLRRTLRQARDEQAAARRRRLLTAGLGAVASAAILFLGGYAAAGHASSYGVARPPVASATPTQPGTDVQVASAADARTGAKMTVRVTPATGWIRLNATVSGVPAGEHCRLVVVAKGGERQNAGSWVTSLNAAGTKSGGSHLNGSASIALENLKSVVVENEQGKQYVSVRF
ncbi:zf-HC2 domain-containing protein [Streptomyces sp. NPDC020362]|uniref:zf-HC2 domain-containing protein n=1 Tax=unclassified Streptomyces TaxID=2593676 RepID=UPI000A99E326